MPETAKTALILYPGELGSAVARVLTDDEWMVHTCLEGRSRATRDRAKRARINVAPTLAEAVAESGLVVSLVPQQAAVATAEAFASAVARDIDQVPLYLDANSVSPETLKRVAAAASGGGADVVDGAFVGSSRMLGGKTTLYLSGPRAGEVAALMPASLHPKVIGQEIGLASAFKLAFAGFNKGLVALFLETATAGDAVGERAELLMRLTEFYPGTIETVERLLPTYPRHARRRAEEMHELAEWLAATGHECLMSAGAEGVLERLAALGLASEEPASLEAFLDECRRRGFLSRGD